MPRPESRTPALRDHVLGVAVDLLARDGVAGFTTRSLAQEARTSTPAVYELFGNKPGLVREVFFEGFRLLRRHLGTVDDTSDPRGDLLRLASRYRTFLRDNPVLSQIMFSRPFTDFDPGPSEVAASASVRVLIVGHVRRCIDAGVLAGDATDVAHAFVALVQGLASAEQAGRLGTSPRSIERRWALALGALLEGLSP